MLSQEHIQLAQALMRKLDGHIDLENFRKWAFEQEKTVIENNGKLAIIRLVLEGNANLNFDGDTDEPILSLTEKGRYEANRGNQQDRG